MREMEAQWEREREMEDTRERALEAEMVQMQKMAQESNSFATSGKFYGSVLSFWCFVGRLMMQNLQRSEVPYEELMGLKKELEEFLFQAVVRKHTKRNLGRRNDIRRSQMEMYLMKNHFRQTSAGNTTNGHNFTMLSKEAIARLSDPSIAKEEDELDALDEADPIERRSRELSEQDKAALEKEALVKKGSLIGATAAWKYGAYVNSLAQFAFFKKAQQEEVQSLLEVQKEFQILQAEFVRLAEQSQVLAKQILHLQSEVESNAAVSNATVSNATVSNATDATNATKESPAAVDISGIYM
jgi:hypothetical protein